jgi:hypothetical protein
MMMSLGQNRERPRGPRIIRITAIECGEDPEPIDNRTVAQRGNVFMSVDV